MKKTTYIVTGVSIAVVLAVVLGIWRVSETPETKPQAEAIAPVKPVVQERDLKKERQDRLAMLIRTKGGLPADQALAQATTEEQRAYIAKDMAYQKQSAEESLSRVRDKLSMVEDSLAAATDIRKVKALEKQREMLFELMEKFEE